MKAAKIDIVRYAPKGQNSFYDAVTAKVNDYFKSNNVSVYGNSEMWLKTFLMVSLFFGPYIVLITSAQQIGLPFFFLMWFIMGWGMCGIGMGVMHDANHNSYSSKKKTNRFISHILELIGGYKVTWKIQHNILHHTYTNLAGLDEDIDNKFMLRFSPHQPLKWFHRYQFIYAWILYMLTTIFWMTAKDYIQLVRYKKLGLLTKQKISFKRAMWEVTLVKLFYYTYILVIPILVTGVPYYYVIAGFFLMHFTSGFFLSCIFQFGHVMESSEFEKPSGNAGNKRMQASWAIHEVKNTSNFSPKNYFINWFAGGLNFQIEHHLFPHICHVHYRKLAPIVKRTMESYGLKYHVKPSFFRAMLAHAAMLRMLGRRDTVPLSR